MKKLLLALFALALMFVITACGGESDSTTNAPAPTTADSDVLVDSEVAALLAEWNLPAPRFTPDGDIPSWQQDQDHFVEITWYVNFGWWSLFPFGEDLVTRVAREELGINITFLHGDDDNLNMMLAGGDLPDIITMAGGNPLTREAHNFAFPLDVLSQVYDPYFLNHVAPIQVVNWHSLADGHFYGMPNDAMSEDAIVAGYAWNNAGFLVRGDIYDAIGPVDMTTPEGFLDALRAAKEFAPETDHGVPLVAFAGHAMDIVAGEDGAFGSLLQDFLAIPVTDANGDWYDRDADSEYLEWLLVFRQAMEEGLMNNDQFSDDGALMQERFGLGTYFAYMTPNTFDTSWILPEIAARNPQQMYNAISGPRNRAGDDHTLPAGSLAGWTQTFVTLGSSDPQTAMQVITYFASDHGTSLALFGVEGETFDWVDGLAVMRPEVEELRLTDPDQFDAEYGIGRYWMLRSLEFANAAGNLPTGHHATHVEFAQQFNHARLEFSELDPLEGQIQRDVSNLGVARTQAIVAVIQAPDDVTATQIWQDFLASRADFGFDEITEYRNNRLQENRQRLGQ